MQVLPHQGVMFEGHLDEDGPALAAALTECCRWLQAEHGMSIREATHWTTWVPGLVAYAFHGDADDTPEDQRRGMVQEHHDGARPVTIIHLQPLATDISDTLPPQPFALTRFPEVAPLVVDGPS